MCGTGGFILVLGFVQNCRAQLEAVRTLTCLYSQQGMRRNRAVPLCPRASTPKGLARSFPHPSPAVVPHAWSHDAAEACAPCASTVWRETAVLRARGGAVHHVRSVYTRARPGGCAYFAHSPSPHSSATCRYVPVTGPGPAPGPQRPSLGGRGSESRDRDLGRASDFRPRSHVEPERREFFPDGVVTASSAGSLSPTAS